MNPDLLYLIQTETTVGFLSQNKKKIAKAKQRDENQPILKVVDSLSNLDVRVPQKFKNRVRRSKKTTFIYNHTKEAIRVVAGEEHKKFIKKFKFMYSSSANLTGEPFNEEYATKQAEVIVKKLEPFAEKTPSKILLLSKTKIKRIR